MIVNCTGLAARFLGGVNDADVYPTRGQTVLVWAPQVKMALSRYGWCGANDGSKRCDMILVISLFNKSSIYPSYAPYILYILAKDALTYIIPRENGEVILGGTLQDYNRYLIFST